MTNPIVMSLGAGVQSSTLLHLAVDGKLLRPDLVIFADTQCEPSNVYRQLWYLQELCFANGIPLEIVTKGNLIQDQYDEKLCHIPAYFIRKKAGILQRQCTVHYKLEPIDKFVRKYFYIKKNHPIAIIKWLGISIDEQIRRQTAWEWYSVNKYPLVDLNMSRNDCYIYLREKGYRLPGKSSCIICPFHSNEYWKELKEKYPSEFQTACEFDNNIRDIRKHKGVTFFIHRSLKPLQDVDFRNKYDMGQLRFLSVNFNRDCSGICNT